MFDQSHGLRFDIYERIHLSEELPGIAELEEVELLPEIQVIQREDRAELYGQLLLTGLYRSEDDRTERLEHAIPVEITVPLTRVSSLDDIGVEIENFDIDLLTMRSVNITGVLSLRGIKAAEAVPVWQQEEYTVAYSPAEEERGQSGGVEAEGLQERESDALYENSLWTFGEGAVEELVAEHTTAEAAADITYDADFSEPVRDKELAVRTEAVITDERKEPVAPEVTASTDVADTVEVVTAAPNTVVVSGKGNESAVDDTPAEVLGQETAANTEILPEPAPSLSVIQEAEAPAEIAAVPEEKPDLKVALGSKKEAKADEKEKLSFSSLLNSSRVNEEQKELSAAVTAPAAASVEPAGDREWKSKFIGGSQNANLFRKVRLCIVQREETLDSIAEKYQLSARELVMYNRLAGQNVEEGQVLYIP